MAEEAKEKEQMEKKPAKKTDTIGKYRCMKDSYLDGDFYQRGHIYDLKKSYAELFPESFQIMDLKTPNTAATFDPTGDAIKDANVNKYTQNIFTGPSEAPAMGMVKGN